MTEMMSTTPQTTFRFSPGLFECTLICFSTGGAPFLEQEGMQMNLMLSSFLLWGVTLLL